MDMDIKTFVLLRGPALSSRSVVFSVLLIFFVSAALAFFSQNYVKLEPYRSLMRNSQSTDVDESDSSVRGSDSDHREKIWPDEGFWLRLTGAARDLKSRSRCSYDFAGCSIISNETDASSHVVHPIPNPSYDQATDACPFYFRYIYEDLAPWAQEHNTQKPHDDGNNDKLNNNNTTSIGSEDTDESGGTVSSSSTTISDDDARDLKSQRIIRDVAGDSSEEEEQGNNGEGETMMRRRGGVTREILEGARSVASFRVVIKNGKLYVDAYGACFQTRSTFTIWGLLQLLRFYPGLVPDVDLLFGCGDTPMVPTPPPPDPNTRSSADHHQHTNPAPPPIFRYCSTLTHLDIPFPDWSFWGWPEVDLGSWDSELCGILKGQNELLWEQRIPTAFWKGNTGTGGQLRGNLKQCNGPSYGTEIIHQDWHQAANDNYKNSRLADQCKNRYKIYVEGWGWSVSLKYIFACDSPVLVVDPVFHDFFSRGLTPLEHYLPISRDNLCNSIKLAVEWGNNNTIKADRLGRAGRQFITKEVSMKHVYDYMLHILREYAKLLRYEPTPTAGMVEMCREAFLCQAPGEERERYEESMVKQASSSPPCAMEARSEQVIEGRKKKKRDIIGQAERDPASVFNSM